MTKVESRWRYTTDKEREDIARDYVRGDLVEDIAARYDRPVSTIKRVVARAGVPRRANGRPRNK